MPRVQRLPVDYLGTVQQRPVDMPGVTCTGTAGLYVAVGPLKRDTTFFMDDMPIIVICSLLQVGPSATKYKRETNSYVMIANVVERLDGEK